MSRIHNVRESCVVAAAAAATQQLIVRPVWCSVARALARRRTGKATRPRTTQPLTSGKRADPSDPAPRSGSLSWDEYFMAVAFLSAMRSKDPNKQVGACIVGRNRVILGIGYNGFPRGCQDKDLPWAKQSEKGPLGTKYPFVVHAEANALLNTNHSDTCGSSLYVTMFPCSECAKLVIQAGIQEVVYFEGKAAASACERMPQCEHAGASMRDVQYAAATMMFDLAGVLVRQCVPGRDVRICM